MRIVLVCGDRNWTDKEKIRARLAAFTPEVRIMHGDCRGADRLAGRIADGLGLRVIACPANWTKYGRRAGPIRNREMLDLKPELVIAFHPTIAASKGTADCVNEASRRGIPVEVIP